MTAQMQAITKRVADHYSVAYRDIVANREQRRQRYRAPHLVEARRVAMFVIRQSMRASYPEIARFFHVDHTSVIGACKKIGAARVLGAESLIDQILFPSTRVGNA